MCSKPTETELPLVNIQIVGVQKAGTSALAHFLAQHPDVCLVDGKEAHVFDQPEFAEQTDKTAFAKNRYAKKFAHYQGEKLLCDATPITIFNPSYLQACVEYNRDARFIVMLRDPVERAFSHYQMSKSRGREQHNALISFLIESFRLRKEGADERWRTGSAWRDFSYLKRGEYKHQLNLLHELVPKNQILILSQQDLFKSHQQTLDRVFQFLQVEPMRIDRETIFSQEPKKLGFSDHAAKLYAKLYFSLRG